MRVRDRLCLVVNPAAGGGRGTRALPAVLGALGTRPAGVRVCQTTSLDHAARTAAEAAAHGEVVVAVGGDGLVGSLAGTVAGEGGVLGIIPAGRGNDFARMLGIPFRPAGAAEALLTGTGRAVDLIGVRAGDGPEHVVAGSVYLGVPSEGGEIANGSRMPTGPVGYQRASPLAAGSPLRIRALPGALRVIAPALWATRQAQPSPETAGRA